MVNLFNLTSLTTMEVLAYKQFEGFDTVNIFGRSEGIIPAPESSHTIHATINEAKKAIQEGKS